jgi:hypothetical protein
VLFQDTRVRARVARIVRGFLRIGQSHNKRLARIIIEGGDESEVGGVDCATEGRCEDLGDLGLVGEG